MGTSNLGTLNINSEVGTLKKVMLHRPGRELERIMPGHLTELLFEDIPWLRRMKQEHDSFAKELVKNGVEIFYVEDLLKDVLGIEGVRKDVLSQILESSDNCDKPVKEFLYGYLAQKNLDDFTNSLIGGITKEDIREFKKEKSLSDYIIENNYFYINPLPNLYFMRDPAVVIGNGLAVSSMYSPIRKRESLFLRLIYENHEIFKNHDSMYYSNDYNHSLEGGDVLILSKDTLAVGCSQRTGVAGIEMLADKLFNSDSGINKLLIIQIPKVRAYMHLDTVFTMVDRDKFTIYPGVLDKINVVSVFKTENNKFDYRQEENLKSALEKVLGYKNVDLIPSGGANPVTAAREQWNDSTNTLAVAPGRVFAYGRNEVSNRVLREHGIDVIELEASELVRGRGGPRCMSMPLYREEF
ncbi:arginine deiminase [Alkalibacter mobilis]|uniref:arginine deiminase n=1 Tax=Alkalibacter mobilis TaxID=2787712 RepID=UPI002FC28C5C